MGFAYIESSKLDSISKAQGTIEYLVIIAVVVVVGLVVVGLLMSMAGSGAGVAITSSEIGGKIGVGGISFIDAVVDNDGNGLITLSNNSGGVLTITRLSVDGFDSNYSDTLLGQGDEKTFALSAVGSDCSCVGFEGKTKTCEVVIYAESEYGLEKQFATSVSVDCVGEAVASNPLAVVPFVIIEELPAEFCTTEGDKNTTSTIEGDVVYCDNSLKMWTITGPSTYSWGPAQNEPSNSCTGLGSSYPACNYCEELTYAGYSDWILPSCASGGQNSGCQLYQFGIDACGSYSCTPAWDTNGVALFYWSSTEHSINPASSAWGVYFSSGGVNDGHKVYDSVRVRCVRE
jgi:hypothetical protein